MGLWSAYFLAKLLLYARGDLDFNPWLNLAFAAFTALPAGEGRHRFAKNLIAVPAGVLLLYHDSWLPPLTQLLSQGEMLHAIEPVYLWLFVYRSISWPLLLELALMLGVYALLRRKMRMSTIAFIGLVLAVAAPGARLLPPPQAVHAAAPLGAAAPAGAFPVPPDIDPRNMRADALDARLAQFYAAERLRQVRFPGAATGGVPYDIVILHVSSLSWDDLQAVDQSDDSLFSRFDIVFTRFNSAASYDGPAAARLLRGACGQTPEKQLSDPISHECSVVDGLESAGFEFERLANHDAGAEGGGGAPLSGDYAVLSRWLAKRPANPAPRVALYYDTSSLRDGNHGLAGAHGDSSYAVRLSRLAGDMNRFLDDLQRSGRHAVVLFIADHGAALNGDHRQITGLREIPTAAIVEVPVGVALVNAARPPLWTQQRIDSPTSYLAVNELLARFIADDPFDKSAFNPGAYTQGLPRTDLVAENNGITIVRIGHRDMMRAPDGTWSSLGPADGGSI
jgi:hypothetical protein